MTFDPMYQWACDLFPINRSLTGEGIRETLRYLQNLLPDLQMHSIESGTKAFDWTVPDEWNITEGYLEDESGERVVDFKTHNLHVVGYSEPVDKWLTLDELQEHLYSLPDQPDAIPYITSYYKRRWGFCLTHNQREKLKAGKYHAVIKSVLEKGVLNYADLLIKGRESKEILLSTYVCHPSMANNELSGPVVTTALARWILAMPNRRYSYRIVFIPETIGAVVYLSRNLEQMRANTISGHVVTCVGDDRAYSMMPSRYGDTLADRAVRHSLKHNAGDYTEYSFFDRGSDERQYCSPNVDLPVASIMRSKYWVYPEYHTSLDDLNLISQRGLEGAFKAIAGAIEAVEMNDTYHTVNPCEPFLSQYNLYPTLGTKETAAKVRSLVNLLTYSDGKNDLLKIADMLNVPIKELYEIAIKLIDCQLIKKVG